MDLAFNTLFFAAMVTPAVLLRVGVRWKHGTDTRARVFEPTFLGLSEELSWLLPLTIVLHIVAGLIIGQWYGYSIHLLLVTSWLTSFGPSQVPAAEQIVAHLYLIAVYFLILSTLSFGLGYTLQRIIRMLGFDRRYGWLEYRSAWTYFFRGEQPNEKSKSPVAIYITVAVRVADQVKPYSGIVDWFLLDNSGELKTFSLIHTQSLEPTSSGGPSDEFMGTTIFRYSDALHLSIAPLYLSIEKKEESNLT